MPRGSPPSSPEGTVWFGGHPHGATLCLRFCDDNLDPDEITRLMAHAPTRSQRKGQPVLDSLGQTKRIGRTGSWLLERSLGEQETIEEGIQSLFCELPGDDKIWAALGQRFQVDLLCDVFVRGVNQGFVLSPSVLELLARRGIALGVDVFCKPDKEQAEMLQERLS
jgi:hypothetical protein